MSARIVCGDSRQVLRDLDPCSIDGLASDPPYALVSIVRRFGGERAAPARAGASGVYARASAGFMGQSWDTGDTAFDPAFWWEVLRVLKPGAHVVAFGGTRTYHRLVCALEDAGFEIRDQLAWIYGSGFPKSHRQTGPFDGWGTALKPAFEPIVLARKPLDGTVAENLRRWGVGALNIDECRTAEGRWPANLLHDGSAEVLRAFPDAPGQQRAVGPQHGARPSVNVYGDYGAQEHFAPRGDTGSAARFFYSAKASRAERAGADHPTVKPIAVMRWLCRMIAPPGALILDPFAGSGTTGIAARAEGQRSLLIEREPRYCGQIERRLAVLT
nr:site-specific DNA-methyltransferase [uncultured Brevundimonas sp.]